MKRDLALAVGIILVSSAAGLAFNMTRTPPMELIRRPMPEPASPVVISPVPGPDGKAHPASQPMSAPKPGVVVMDVVLKALADGTVHFIDARSTEDYAKGHLRGSLNLPSETIYQSIKPILERVPTVEKVIVYCGGGDCEASHNVADALRRDFNFTDVTIYEKGWQEVMSKPAQFESWISTGDQP